MTIQVDTLDDITGDDDFAELEALVNPKPAKPDADDPDEGFDELEELLGEALKEKALGESVAKARAKARSGYKLADEDLARIRAWELAREWLPVANVALFHRYACACGNHQTIFEGRLLEQRHRTQAASNRWTSQASEQPGLPRKTALRKSLVPMCQRCSAASGYSLVTDLEWSA
jgi:hypothetical protein